MRRALSVDQRLATCQRVYHVMASKPGYSLRADDVVDEIEVRLAPWRTIVGVVRDEYGEPVQGAAVQLWQPRGVPPDTCLVTASVRDPRAGDWPGYALTYDPGTSESREAQSVPVDASTPVPTGWMLHTIRMRGVDVSDRPIVFGRDEQWRSDVEIVLTDRVTVASRTVVDRDRRPASRA